MFAKPETTVQESVSTFVSVKPLGIFNEMLADFHAGLMETLPKAFHKILVQDSETAVSKRPLFKMMFQHFSVKPLTIS